MRESDSTGGSFGISGPRFDALVALDCWPSVSVPAALRAWRRLIEAGRGVIVVAGTDTGTDTGTGAGADARTAPEPGMGAGAAAKAEARRASQQWADELREGGFEIELIAKSPVTSHHYEALAQSARGARAALRAVLGAGPANSYLTHVERLEDSVRLSRSERFEIIARAPGGTAVPRSGEEPRRYGNVKASARCRT
ncbi:hypothetical protein [Streptomyces sp. NPDC088400]|uniref:hypothetical protein n=1 Tax=Streptomyces sp. NPDC088400 TaxID=3365861 RepID=UPI00382DE26D